MSETERWAGFTDAIKRRSAHNVLQHLFLCQPPRSPTWYVPQERLHATVCHHASPSPYWWKEVVIDIRTSERGWQQCPLVIFCTLKSLEVLLSWRRMVMLALLQCSYAKQSWSKLWFPHNDDSSCFPKLSFWMTADLENHLLPWAGARGMSDLSTHEAISCQISTAIREGC